MKLYLYILTMGKQMLILFLHFCNSPASLRGYFFQGDCSRAILKYEQTDIQPSYAMV